MQSFLHICKKSSTFAAELGLEIVMKKNFLLRVNVLLGVISLWLAGCHSSKATVKEEPRHPRLKYGTPEVRAMYGVMMPDEPVDTLAAPADTVVMEQPKAPQRPPQIMVKYGVPPVRNNQ